MTYRVHVQRPDEWRQARAIRLAMLRDTPTAFCSRYEDAAGWPDEDWQKRQAGAGPDVLRVSLTDVDPAPDSAPGTDAPGLTLPREPPTPPGSA